MFNFKRKIALAALLAATASATQAATLYSYEANGFRIAYGSDTALGEDLITQLFGGATLQNGVYTQVFADFEGSFIYDEADTADAVASGGTGYGNIWDFDGTVGVGANSFGSDFGITTVTNDFLDENNVLQDGVLIGSGDNSNNNLQAFTVGDWTLNGYAISFLSGDDTLIADESLPGDLTALGGAAYAGMTFENSNGDIEGFIIEIELTNEGNVATPGFHPGVTVVPVPAAAWLFGSALVGLAGVRRRR